MKGHEAIRPLMERTADSPIGLQALRDRNLRGRRPITDDFPEFEQLAPEQQWAVLLTETFRQKELRRALGQAAELVIAVADAAWDDLHSGRVRGRDGDVQAEIDAREAADAYWHGVED
jgi:hypothetical protein